MRRNLSIPAVFILLAFVALPDAFGQKSQRVNFKRGATQATISGKLNGFKDKKAYSIKVLKGQTLNIEQIKSEASTRYVSVSILSPSGEDATDADASCNSRKEINPTEAGDYLITVYECEKADEWRSSFKLKITVKFPPLIKVVTE